MNIVSLDKEITYSKGVVIFDGYCILCNKTVKFLIKIDKKKELLFTTLTSKLGKKLAGEFSPNNKSIVFIMQNKKYFKSDAVIKIFQVVGMPWNILLIFKIVPRFIRDSIYMLIANNRYKLFGKNNDCMIPGKDVSDRFYF